MGLPPTEDVHRQKEAAAIFSFFGGGWGREEAASGRTTIEREGD